MKDLKSVSGCKQILRFVQDDTKGGDLLRMTGRGRGLVSWSVGQFLCTHLFVCGVMIKWCVCSDWLIEKKNK